jgi:hypothetical protein
MFRAYAKAFADAYEYLNNQNFDEAQANLDYQECYLELATVYRMNRIGVDYTEAQITAIA